MTTAPPVRRRRRSWRSIDEALRAFGRLTVETGPTNRELQAALGLASTSTAAYWLQALADEGLIERRGVTLGDRPWRLTAKGRAALEGEGAAR